MRTFSPALSWRDHTTGRSGQLLNFSTKKSSARHTHSQRSLAQYGRGRINCLLTSVFDMPSSMAQASTRSGLGGHTVFRCEYWAERFINSLTAPGSRNHGYERVTTERRGVTWLRILMMEIAPASLVHQVWEYPLFDALFGRRSRRFGLGFEMAEGPFKYKSRHEPLPLS